MTRATLTIVLLLIASVAAKLASKQLAGPPEEFTFHRIPSPDGGAIYEKSALLPVTLTAAEVGMEWTTTFPVDSDKMFSFSIYSPFEQKLSLVLKDPSGQVVSLEGRNIPGHWPISSDGSHFIPGTSYKFEKPVTGSWSLEITSPELLTAIAASGSHAVVIVYNDASVEIASHVNTYALKVGGEVGLVTKVIDTAQASTLALKDTVVSAELEVITPTGSVIDVPMHDDGLHYDGAANDGVYGGFIKPTEQGIYETQAVVVGKTAAGTEFMRTTQHVVEVLDTQLTLNSVATGSIDEQGERIIINLEVTSTNADDTTKFRPYVEVHGVKDSKPVAVAWLSTITTIQTVNDKKVLPLELDLNWLAHAGATVPLTLQNVYVSDVQSSIPVVSYDQITVTIPSVTHSKAKLLVSKLGNVTEITKQMRNGRNPLVRPAPGAEKTGIVLLHGYCSDTNQWEKHSHIFDEAYFFLNPSANIRNDHFAELAASFAQDTHSLTTFGLLGHSQGGMASLHLHAFYWSGLEEADTSGGKRLIQTVGTPYMGNTGAGTAADLIAIFGYSCGANTDLSVDGARLWLSGVPMTARADVYYYTTTYKLGTWFGDWCNFAVNLVLEWPNDGTCEFEYAQLAGGHNQGNKEQWCHSTDMTYPPQTNDEDRNEQLNVLAAR